MRGRLERRPATLVSQRAKTGPLGLTPERHAAALGISLNDLERVFSYAEEVKVMRSGKEALLDRPFRDVLAELDAKKEK